MSQYTPSTGEVRRRYAYARSAGSKNQRAVAEFDRWLAAHDAEVRARAFREAAGVARNYDTGYDTTAATISEALTDAAEWREVRAGVVTEEPEWEYGTALRTPQGALWDFEFEGTREAAEWHVRACEKDGHEHGMDNCVIVRRAPRISAGEWEVEPS